MSWSAKTARPVSLPPNRQHCLRSGRVLLDPVDCLPTEIGDFRDGADALLLVEHRANDVELCAGVAWLTAFVFDLGLLLRVRCQPSGQPWWLPPGPAPSRP